jgi:hypothetical protein
LSLEARPIPVPHVTARFWAAIEHAADPQELEVFREADVYGLRSLTAHMGDLHGIEGQYGSPIYLPGSPDDPVQGFNFGILLQMRSISRRLLLDELGAADP